MEWGSAKSGMGLAFPLQALMASVGPVGPINDWIFQKKGATIDTPSNLDAAQHLEQWIKSGYFPKDINAIEYTDAASRFTKGEGVFTFNGDWQNAGYDTGMPGNVGFFVMPPAEARWRPGGHVRPADLRHRNQGQERGLCRVLPELGCHQPGRSRRSTSPSVARTPVGRLKRPCPR